MDESGILWIGTKDGVKKYNGNYIESVNFMGINNWIQSNLVPDNLWRQERAPICQYGLQHH